MSVEVFNQNFQHVYLTPQCFMLLYSIRMPATKHQQSFFATMTTETHTLASYHSSLLCRPCLELPLVDEYYEITHTLHNSLEDLESCPCSFCAWLWAAICADMSIDSVESFKRRTSSSTSPVELHWQLRNGESMAYLGRGLNTILMLPIYTSPGMSSFLINIEMQAVLCFMT